MLTQAIAQTRSQFDEAVAGMNFPTVDWVIAVPSKDRRAILFAVWFRERVELFGGDTPLGFICDLPEPISGEFDAAAAVHEFMRRPSETVH
jgi:hypothetical protein